MVLKIIHIGLASYFTEGMHYQDNQLSSQNKSDGHEVVFVSNPEKYVDGKIEYVGCCDRVLKNGVRLVRLPYRKILGEFLTRKIRMFVGLEELLESFVPDIIFCHDLAFLSVIDVIRYKRRHPEVKLFADTHTNADNSGRNWLSLNILHRVFYRYLVKTSYPFLEKYFYVGEGERLFNEKNYGVPNDRMEFFPLGGNLLTKEQYQLAREQTRGLYNVQPREIFMVHSGKLGALKRTKELLQAFSNVDDLKAKLIIVGLIPKDMESVLMPLIEGDNRVQYVGWKSGSELIKILCGCDLYLQPGSVSATMQNAVCCGAPLMLYPHNTYVKDFDYGNIVWVKSQIEIENCFRSLKDKGLDLKKMSENSWRCARELLDYRKLASRIYR